MGNCTMAVQMFARLLTRVNDLDWFGNTQSTQMGFSVTE